MVIPSKSSSDWNDRATPDRARRVGDILEMSSSSTPTLPSAAAKPLMASMSDVLPAPFGPIRPVTVPGLPASCRRRPAPRNHRKTKDVQGWQAFPRVEPLELVRPRGPISSRRGRDFQDGQAQGQLYVPCVSAPPAGEAQGGRRSRGNAPSPPWKHTLATRRKAYGGHAPPSCDPGGAEESRD